MFGKNLLPVLFFSLLLVLFLSGCGSTNSMAPPPTGNFSNASLNGSYAFTLSGTNAGGPFAVAGQFQANGAGTITGGTEDINSPGTVGVLTNQPITSGTYAV